MFLENLLIRQMRSHAEDDPGVPEVEPSRQERTLEVRQAAVGEVFVTAVDGEQGGEEQPPCVIELRKKSHLRARDGR
jgi:hypothetical protein